MRMAGICQSQTNISGEAVRPDLVENLPDLPRLLTGLLNPARLAEVHKHPLRAHRDQRNTRGDEDVP